MEEETLLRERLQAITDKRRIREEIEKKRRKIEEEKLKLQYLKKKTLREQWLMDGFSSLSPEEEQSAKAQTEDVQQQTQLLQSSIERIDMEIVALETQELEISAREELLLKQLKEVERTSEDIIKEVNANIHPEPVQYIYTTIPDSPKCHTPATRRKIFITGKPEADEKQEKKAIYSMKIRVEKDLRTGVSHILSTITPQDLQQHDGRESQNDVNEMSPLEVEELLMKASEKKVPADVEYHEPVFSSPFSQPTTQKTERSYVSRHGLHMPSKTLRSSQALNLTNQEARSLYGNQSPTNILAFKTNQYLSTNERAQIVNNGLIADSVGDEYGSISQSYSPILECEKRELPVTQMANSGLGFGRCSPLNPTEDSGLNLECSKPITMIFMGYQTAESGEEDEGIQSELVVIGDEDEVDGEDTDTEDAPLSYHPLGYHSKIFKPNNTMYRSEIRPGGIRTYNPGGRTFRNKLENPVAKDIL